VEFVSPWKHNEYHFEAAATSAMSKNIGIDLGTTSSVAAYMVDAGPRLIPNALGEVLTPSVVGIL
jgi:molecular chaperone DnaK (HSP70)